jgi:uncharacterized protein (TIGR02001 family)
MEGRILKRFVLYLLFIFTTPCFAIEETPVDTPPKNLNYKPFVGTFGVTTNYLSEGISNTNNAPGIQGTATYTFSTTGIYLNVLGTNADFIDPQFNHATVEFDTIIGITNNINNDWSYDIYLDRYNYPGAPAANYMDFITTLTYKILSATMYYSSNVYGSHGTGIYLNGAVNYEIPEKYIKFSNITALASLGHYQLPASTGMHSYYNYMLGLQKEIKAFTLSLQYSNTSGANIHPWDGYHIVGTVLYTF